MPIKALSQMVSRQGRVSEEINRNDFNEVNRTLIDVQRQRRVENNNNTAH